VFSIIDEKIVFWVAEPLGQGLLLQAASNKAAMAHSGQRNDPVPGPRIKLLLVETKPPRVVAARDDRNSKAWRGF
jgi:hypothetical protein